MYLKSIRLRDWKAFREAELSFPPPGRRKNVVLIGAKNGYGKTSLLEAIMFGLYGREAMRFVARAGEGDPDEKRLAMNYSQFLESALHARAIPEARTMMSVSLEFVGDEEAEELPSLTIERRWHFSDSGRHLSDRDDVVITGADGKRLRPTKLDDEEDFYRGIVARRFLPPHLAQFFLFDGERVQRLARRDMKEQVRLGIEGLLGTAVLRELADDLRKYSNAKRRSVSDIGADKLRELSRDVAELEGAEEEARKRKSELLRELDILRARRDELMLTLQGGTDGAVLDIRRTEEERAHLWQELNQHREQLSGLLVGEFALALAGSGARRTLSEQLSGELRLARWKAVVAASVEQASRFSDALFSAAPHFEPPLTESQVRALRQKIKAAWHALWHPPPPECADHELHSYLSASDKEAVLKRLDEVEKFGQDAVDSLLHKIDSVENELRKIDQRIATHAGVKEIIQDAADQLSEVSEKIGNLEKTLGDIERHLEAVRGQLAAKRAEHNRALGEFRQARPVVARAERAEQIADMLEEFVGEAVEEHVAEVAEHMTQAYREMAHTHAIYRIEIQADCNVRLLARNGHDIRDIGHSAGENQIFALALISAISEAAGIRFPFVIDTPLARLDREHRRNVLKHFTGRAGEQIILLSQDKEVVGEELEAIKGRVAASFLVEASTLPDGKKQSRVTAGRYFEDF